MTCCNNKCCKCCCKCGGCCKKDPCECTIKPINGCRGDCECKWFPVDERPAEVTMRRCCDQNGCCGMFPEKCRNIYWPDFSHPRWLCCKDLYCAR